MTANATGPHQITLQGWISAAPFERLLNISILQAVGGKAVLSAPFLFDYAQGAGLMHGGALVSLADTAAVMAIKSTLPEGSHFATVKMETRFLLPVRKGVVTARAEVVFRVERTIEAKATLFDDEGRVVVEFASTFKIARSTPLSTQLPGA